MEEEKGLAWPEDRPLRWRLRVGLLAAGAASAILAQVLSRFPNFIEKAYTEALGQWFGRTLAALTGWIPFSVGEALLAALLLWLLALTIRAVYHVARRRRRWSNALACGVLHAGAVAGVIVLAFYWTWGFNYDRAGLIDRMQWQDYADGPKDEAALAELEHICRELVEAANNAYLALFKVEDLGAPTKVPLSRKALNMAIDGAYRRVAKDLGLHWSFAVSRGPAKPVFFSEIMCYTLILGVYCPFTGEANYNRKMPDCTLPEVIAHEKAHQRGITSEDEANFFGYLVCASSKHPYLQYSAYLTAQRRFLSELIARAPERGKALLAERHPGVQRDVDACNAFAKAYAGRVSRVQHRVNDLYLKANRVKGGVKAYGMSAQLILAYARAHGGSCIVETVGKGKQP
ncbi:MAG TPA: DUF3810 domain-containing protein [Candidatus Hydrogenedentes bacterium]|nr:DUF3810 domain-containing protein [Candidatus Hydrogenedentota bacterium]HOV73620.1 DUF3810 domain-containing protein [Candidatus Hydrogenedentota bacterium]HPC16336.1 DUF3810 domain-containing protein [Candidatus Hydrogenedentota bacterium]HRT20746.1 DUF3810 domain-containing protein [Candidatus Hydrogenedentota bacterium]HRT66748.1 DUF3810 domain-containing protein [Candidatus Hydrogenedentota bacterium]